MEIVWSLGLIVGIALALNYMAGGKASGVLRPVTQVLRKLFGLCLNAVLQLGGICAKLIGGSVKTIGPQKNSGDGGSSPKPPKRW